MSRGLLFVFASIAFVAGCGGSQPATPPAGDTTYWQDVAPIYDAKCVRCHQDGGIAPFRLDRFSDARANAGAEIVAVKTGIMPPYEMVHDGSCGSFHDERALSADEKATIQRWVDGGLAEGTAVTLPPPDQPTLQNAVSLATPTFSPVAQGGELAKFDEYRCFLMDPPTASDTFLTGYDVVPGDAAVVHHVIMFIVDPQATGHGGQTNAAIMQALDDQSPDRLGWPCFGGAGDGVNASGAPVTWAPGQGIVEYPTGMGAPIRTTDKLVVQMHYNLADVGTQVRTDQTTIHLRFAPSVDRQVVFILPDPFLGTLDNATPDSLPPRQADTPYTWTLGGRELGIDGTDIPWVDLVAVMPHMHGRGIRQTLRIADGPSANLDCAAHLENWNFHWQQFYFYKTPIRMTADSKVQLTCEYNTSADTTPVLPGWGTRNEMCLAVMMVALPAQ